MGVLVYVSALHNFHGRFDVSSHSKNMHYLLASTVTMQWKSVNYAAKLSEATYYSNIREMM